MALTREIDQARRQATRANRNRQQRAEIRLEEIVKVAGIADDYMSIDREGDMLMETWFASAYHAADSSHMQSIIVDGFVKWQRTDRAEEQHVNGEVGGSVQMLKDHNPYWIDGAAVPAGSDGAA